MCRSQNIEHSSLQVAVLVGVLCISGADLAVCVACGAVSGYTGTTIIVVARANVTSMSGLRLHQATHRTRAGSERCAVLALASSHWLQYANPLSQLAVV